MGSGQPGALRVEQGWGKVGQTPQLQLCPPSDEPARGPWQVGACLRLACALRPRPTPDHCPRPMAAKSVACSDSRVEVTIGHRPRVLASSSLRPTDQPNTVLSGLAPCCSLQIPPSSPPPAPRLSSPDLSVGWQVSWRAVSWGLGLQFALGLFVIRTEPGFIAFRWMGNQIQVHRWGPAPPEHGNTS